MKSFDLISFSFRYRSKHSNKKRKVDSWIYVNFVIILNVLYDLIVFPNRR